MDRFSNQVSMVMEHKSTNTQTKYQIIEKESVKNFHIPGKIQWLMSVGNTPFQSSVQGSYCLLF